MIMEWTIKKHSMIVIASNYHVYIICIESNLPVKDPEFGIPLFDPTLENVDDACDS